MTTATPHPPTTLHESTPLRPSSAESFLSAFLTDASRRPNQNEIVMTNLLRVQQALAGVYVPPPPPLMAPAAAADAGGGEVLTKGEAGTGEIVREGTGEGGCAEAGVDGEKGKVEVEGEVVSKVVPVEAAEAGGVDRRKRRAEKVRRREERKAKRARRGKEEEKGKNVDESE